MADQRDIEAERARHLRRVCSGFSTTISAESAQRLARLLRLTDGDHAK
ncbi:hypothetical protein [Streptomyces yunnanensis]|uniref:Uncharacterized protein n=1 Tax=Streptomyces yunnanensis TaxID=156453 RepID=A0A9X8MSA6_9ACTN|nr:hypothetical protein [Streptomyces yunnanensis]SHL61127.1 hypothetical protein SAMN05216268_105249 [Streptomyces yunnanensis]